MDGLHPLGHLQDPLLVRVGSIVVRRSAEWERERREHLANGGGNGRALVSDMKGDSGAEILEIFLAGKIFPPLPRRVLSVVCLSRGTKAVKKGNKLYVVEGKVLKSHVILKDLLLRPRASLRRHNGICFLLLNERPIRVGISPGKH